MGLGVVLMGGFVDSFVENVRGQGSPAVRQVDDALVTDLYDHACAQSALIGIRPYKDDGGLQRGMQLLSSLHDVQLEGRVRKQNVTPGSAFELVYDDDEEILQYRFAPGDEGMHDRLDRQLKTYYGDSDIVEIEPEFLDMAAGQYVAAARLKLRQDDSFLPIKHFKLDPDHFETDPYDSITSEMVGAPHRPNADVMVQIMIKPAISNATWDRRNWYHGIGKTVRRLKESKSGFDAGAVLKETASAIGGGQLDGVESDERQNFTKYREEASNSKAANIVASQRGKKGYHVDIRVVAVSDSKEEAMSRVEETAGMYRKFYDSSYEQGFTPKFFKQKQLDSFLESMASREWTGTDQGITFATDTLTGICHVPTDLNTQEIEYTMSKSGRGIPPRTPRFDYDAHDLERATSDPGAIQLAMLSEDDPARPYWYGRGKKNGIEAGVTPEILNIHQFVGGGTGMGKTTFLVNQASQIMNRGHGCLIFDPKGKDADEFLREVPEDREDDLVFVDLTDEYDEQVTFNFMEVPSNAPPDSRAFASAVEALADDVVAIAAQAGGDDNYWGALMNRVTRTLIRGMAKSGRDCTLLDLACCVADSDNLDKFHNWMDEERIHFIRESAKRIADKEDSDLEPLAGRFSQWIENDAVRNLISNPDSTVSIQEAVEDGKIVVVRNDPSSGETEKRLFATALIRRAWVAIREAEDNPPFYVICDEFDSIVTEESNIHKILSEARAFDFCLTLACQNPSNQLPTKVEKAIANQCKTFISYNPGGDEDARLIAKQHSRDIEWEDLMNMSPYTFFMRTLDDNDQLTHSYKVRAFPPVGEVRTEQTGQPGRTDAELDALKRTSLAEYGTTQLTPEEQQEVSHFYSGEQQDAEPTAAASDLSEKAWRNQALKAVYDETIRNGDPGGWIAVADCVDRLNDYLPDTTVSDAGKAWRKVLQEIPDPYIDRREVEDEMQVKPLDTGFLNLGDSENDGKAEHWAPMADAYVPMTQLGFIFEIPEQTGDAMPDGLARLDDVLAIGPDDDPETIADTVNSYRENHTLLHRLAGTKAAYIESEHTTGSTQPSQTVRNLAQAHNAGHRCLFFAREEVAEDVYDTVAVEPFCCRSNHPTDDERRFYTGTQTLTIDGETITRPGGRENVWVYDEQTGEYILRDGEGTVHARFETAADIFTDASAYPDGGDRNVKPPVIPEYEMDGDLREVEWDVIVVPPETTTPMDIRLYKGATQTPLTDLVGHEGEQAEATTETDPTADNTEDGPEHESSPVQKHADDTRSEQQADDGEYLEEDLSGIFE